MSPPVPGAGLMARSKGYGLLGGRGRPAGGWRGAVGRGLGALRQGRTLAVLAGAAGCLVLGFLLRLQHSGPGYCPGKGEPFDRAQQFTVVLNTFKRPDRLRKAIKHYATCPRVREIRVCWSESPTPPEEGKDPAFSSAAVPVKFDVHARNSINNRFVPLPNNQTEGVFNVDDDMLVDCQSLNFAFETWRQAPDTLVGFNPRLHSLVPGGGCKYSYKHFWMVWWHGAYSIILTKAAFTHHKWFQEYTDHLPKQIWQMVHENKNCEDIAMQFLIAHRTRLPPVWVKGHYKDSGVLDFSGGISTGTGHKLQRDECLTK